MVDLAIEQLKKSSDFPTVELSTERYVGRHDQESSDSLFLEKQIREGFQTVVGRFEKRALERVGYPHTYESLLPVVERYIYEPRVIDQLHRLREFIKAHGDFSQGQSIDQVVLQHLQKHLPNASPFEIRAQNGTDFSFKVSPDGQHMRLYLDTHECHLPDRNTNPFLIASAHDKRPYDMSLYAELGGLRADRRGSDGVQFSGGSLKFIQLAPIVENTQEGSAPHLTTTLHYTQRPDSQPSFSINYSAGRSSLDVRYTGGQICQADERGVRLLPGSELYYNREIPELRKGKPSHFERGNIRIEEIDSNEAWVRVSDPEKKRTDLSQRYEVRHGFMHVEDIGATYLVPVDFHPARLIESMTKPFF